MLSPSAVPQTTLSPSAAVPQTMLSPSAVPQTMLSQSAPPQSVPQTMLLSVSTVVPQTMLLTASSEVPQTMLSPSAVPQTMLSPSSPSVFAEPQTTVDFHALADGLMMPCLKVWLPQLIWRLQTLCAGIGSPS